MLKTQVPLTSVAAVNAQHFCKPDPRVSCQDPRNEENTISDHLWKSVMPGKAQGLNGNGKGRESSFVSQYSISTAIWLVLFLPTATLHHHTSHRFLWRNEERVLKTLSCSSTHSWFTPKTGQCVNGLWRKNTQHNKKIPSVLAVKDGIKERIYGNGQGSKIMITKFRMLWKTKNNPDT